MKSKPTYQELEKENNILRKESTEAKFNEQKEILNFISDGVYINSSDYRIEYLNLSMIKMLGSDKTGQKCYKAIYNKDEICEWCIYKKLKKNELITHELKHPVTNKYYNINNSLLGNGSKITSYNDITNRAKIEQNLKKQNEDLAALNEEYEAINEEYKAINEDLIIAKEETEESEHRYHLAMNASLQGTFQVDDKGYITFANTLTARLTGYSPNELPGMSMDNLFRSTKTKAISDVNIAKLLSGKSIHGENILTKKDGSLIEIFFSCAPLHNESGVYQGFIGSISDITERKKAEQELITAREKAEESEQKLNVLIEATPDTIFFKDGSGKWIKANKSGLELFGLLDADYKGKTDIELANITDFYKESLLYCKKSDEGVWQKGEIANVEEIVPTPDGNHKTYDVIKVPLYNKNKSRKGLVIIGRDITERKQAEEKLNKANRLYATLSQVNEAIVRVRDQKELFQKICAIIIEFGKFKFAWIGLVDEEGKFVDSVAHSGKGIDYLKNIHIPLKDKLQPKGPTNRAISEGQSIVINDLETNPNFVPWREPALQKGYRSMAAFPIRISNKVIGALSIYAAESQFFDEAEIALLEEATLDISFALEKFKEAKIRKQAEDALKQSELKFRLLADHTFDWEYWIDEHKNYIYLSKSCKRISGYSTDEFYNNPELLFNIVHSDYREKVENHYGSEMDRLKPNCILEFPIIRKGGDLRWIEHNCTPVFNNQGHFLGRRGNNRDITDRKLADESIHRYSNLLQESLNEIYMFDAESYKFIEVNKSARDNLGYTMKELLELTPPDIKPDYDIKSFEKLVNPLRDKKNEKILFYTNHKRKDGSLYPVEVHLQLSAFEQKHLFTAMTLDITKRKQAEEEVRDSEEKFSKIFELNPEITWIVKEDSRIIVDVNHTFTDILGYSKEEIIGKTAIDLDIWQNNEDRELFYKTYETDNGFARVESEFVTKTGQVIIVDILAKRIEFNKVNHLMAIVRDITELRISEELFRKNNEEMIALDKQIAEYKMMALRSAMNPHFIFNSLNSIQFFILNNEKNQLLVICHCFLN